MHEVSLARALIREAERIAGQHRARGIEKIVLRVGALSGVEPGLLLRAFHGMRRGTMAEAAVLELEDQGLEVACNDCGATTPASLPTIACGRCRSRHVRLVHGEELEFVRLDLAIADAEGSRPTGI